MFDSINCWPLRRPLNANDPPTEAGRGSIYVRADVEGEVGFTVTITNPNFTPEQVRNDLLEGDLYCLFGNTVLLNDNKSEVIGRIEWDGEIPECNAVEADIQLSDAMQPSPRPRARRIK